VLVTPLIKLLIAPEIIAETTIYSPKSDNQMYETFTQCLRGPKRYWHKITQINPSHSLRIDRLFKKQLIMNLKLTSILLILIITRVSATSFAQEITLKRNNISLEQVFKEIKKQTGYDFLLSVDNIANKGLINANFKNTPLKEVLDNILENKSLTYTIEKKTILISAKERSIFDKLIDYFRQINIKGRRLTKWRSEDGVAKPLPPSPVYSDEQEEALILIPYAGAKLRVTAFPQLKNERVERSS